MLHNSQSPIATPHQRGIALLGQGRYQEALNAFDAAIRLRPQSAEALIGKAVTLHRLNRHKDALMICEEALQINPNRLFRI